MTEAEHPAFNTFVSTVETLRSPDGGCAWNRTQTHASLGDYLIEEAYETLDAIQHNDSAHLCEELGDVLLQVVLHSQIAAEKGTFTIDDVCRGINEKMIRRHPHVFGDVKVENANEVAVLWEQVKLAEKSKNAGSNSCKSPHEHAEHKQRTHLLDDVPIHFPALLQAQKISRRAVAAGFEWETLDDVWEKVAEERAELEEAYAAAPKSCDGAILRTAAQNAQIKDCASSPSNEHTSTITEAELEFGDLLFALVNVARKMGIDAEAALRASNEKFRQRFAYIEEAAWKQNRSIEELSIDEMEELWQQAKHLASTTNPSPKEIS